MSCTIETDQLGSRVQRDGVLLYDQDGNPLDVTYWVDGDMDEVRFFKDRFGSPVKNAYPLQQFRFAESLAEVDPATGFSDVVGSFEPVPPPRVPLPEGVIEPSVSPEVPVTTTSPTVEAPATTPPAELPTTTEAPPGTRFPLR